MKLQCCWIAQNVAWLIRTVGFEKVKTLMVVMGTVRRGVTGESPTVRQPVDSEIYYLL